MQKFEHVKINWSPFATNVLDAGEFDLCLPDGTPVDFHRDGCDFVVVVNGKRLATDDNLQMSYWMNQYEIGGLKRNLTQRAADCCPRCGSNNWRDAIVPDTLEICNVCGNSR